MQNKDGLTVRFEPADLKALAGASYFYTEQYAQIGSPTSQGRRENQPNAAVFDLALRYNLAQNKKPFVIDSHLGPAIWNETVVGYKRTLGNFESLTDKEQQSYPRAVQKVFVNLVLDTLGEIAIEESNSKTTDKVADGRLVGTLETGYTLYLDDSGKSIGGEMEKSNKNRGVDFAWFAAGKGADRHYAEQGGNPFLKFKVIRELFNEASRVSCKSVFL